VRAVCIRPLAPAAELSFGHRTRGERRFDGVDALVAQIGADVEVARELLTR
jgi:FAD synthase